MKKKLILAATLVAMTGLSAFGQGYFLFTATKNTVYDAFTTPGTFVSGGGHTMVGFLWGPAATVGLLGATGNPISNTAAVSPNVWTAILNDPQFHFGVNTNTGSTATVIANPSGLAIGGINYNSSGTFPVLNTIGGNTYTLYVIGWNSAFATPDAAAAAGAAVGWSAPFQYAAGNGVISTPLSFSGSGLTAFGVSPVPEPATCVLAGLGAAAMLIFRRRK